MKSLTIVLLFLAAVSMLTGACDNPATVSPATVSQNPEEGQVWWAGASWAYGYSGFDELSKAADLILVGTTSGIADVSQDDRLYFTVSTFDVSKVIKGREMETVLITQTGAFGQFELYDDPLLLPGEESVLFLREFEPGNACVLGGPQGRFTIIDDLVFSMENLLNPSLEIDGWQETEFIDYITEIVGS